MLLRSADAEAVDRERAAVVAMTQGQAVRRLGDAGGTVRVPDMATLRVLGRLPHGGLVVAVRGYVGGVEDTGLRCRACPVSDLVPVEVG